MTAKESKAVARYGLVRVGVAYGEHVLEEMEGVATGDYVAYTDHQSALHAAESLLAEAESRIVALQAQVDAVSALTGALVALAKGHEIKADRVDIPEDIRSWHAGHNEGITECVDRIRAALGDAEITEAAGAKPAVSA